MAEKSHAGSHRDRTAGGMDISEHLKTWNGFWDGLKWTAVALVLIAIYLALFRTG
jgi:hypothetical protein